ncbi:MAG: hypothetical protein GY810_08820 [Aureispira sp.]|nr:hypothetical protein [Aureispira sp.]
MNISLFQTDSPTYSPIYFRLLFGSILFMMLLSVSADAQRKRFLDDHPLATPRESSVELVPEFEYSLSAMLAGVRILDKGTISTKKEDPEERTQEDYKTFLGEIGTYATEVAQKLESADKGQASKWKKMPDELKKIAKSIKSSKYGDAIAALTSAGAKKDAKETLFFSWKFYIDDQKNKMPWVDPANIKVNRTFRSVLHYVSENYDRPFGSQAEMGAVIADAAQALSNSMESPKELSWQGEGAVKMRKEDELRRLASNVAYYEWRLEEPINAQRSALINYTLVSNIKLALYDMVKTLVMTKMDWHKDSSHGKNLLQLYNDTKDSGWIVNGDKAKKAKVKK